MKIDLPSAMSFVATHARILDRRRLQLLLGEVDHNAVLNALDAYRNSDGGYGAGLEPDLRSTESQPGAALHAFEVFAEVAPLTSPHAAALCDWLQSVSLADGGLPFALEIRNPAGCSPWWIGANPTLSNLQITAAVAANAHHAARHDPAVASHPWLAVATQYCLTAIDAITTKPAAYELSFSLQFLDAVADTLPYAGVLLERLGQYVPSNGSLRVEGGTEGETLHLLDFAAEPGRPIRRLVTPEAVTADLERVASQQQADGGWPVDWLISSPAAGLEWRGYATVRALATLQRNSAGSLAM